MGSRITSWFRVSSDDTLWLQQEQQWSSSWTYVLGFMCVCGILFLMLLIFALIGRMVHSVLVLYTLYHAWCLCPEIGTSSINWTKLSRFHLLANMWICNLSWKVIGILKDILFNHYKQHCKQVVSFKSHLIYIYIYRPLCRFMKDIGNFPLGTCSNISIYWEAEVHVNLSVRPWLISHWMLWIVQCWTSNDAWNFLSNMIKFIIAKPCMQAADRSAIKQTNQPVDHLSHLAANKLNWLLH